MVKLDDWVLLPWVYCFALVVSALMGSVILSIIERMLEPTRIDKVRIARQILVLCALSYLAITGFEYILPTNRFFVVWAVLCDTLLLAYIFKFLSLTCCNYYPNHRQRIDSLFYILIASFAIIVLFTGYFYKGYFPRALLAIFLFLMLTLVSIGIRLRHWNNSDLGERMISFGLIYLLILVCYIAFNISQGNPLSRTNILIFVALFPTLLALLSGTIVSILLQLVDELREKADRDWLTKLHNRRYFFDRVPQMLAMVFRQKKTCCIGVIDIDNFKYLNDTYGHTVGDKALKDIAKTILTCLRDQDVIVRWGGEEFLFFLPFEDQEGGILVAQRIRKAVAALQINIASGVTFLTVSIGLNVIHGQDELNIAIARADRNLYTAKEQGKNIVVSSVSGGSTNLPCTC